MMLRLSKTDQEGEGRTVGIPYDSHLKTCSVRAFPAWLQTSKIADGPIFRGVDQQRAGLDAEQFAGYSPRAGLATAAAAAGVSQPSFAGSSTRPPSLNAPLRLQ
jgi:hypothetical protein